MSLNFKNKKIAIQNIHIPHSINTIYLTHHQQLYIHGGINEPKLITHLPTKVSMITNGRRHLLLSVDGSVYSTNYDGDDEENNYGQNGFGSIAFTNNIPYGFHKIPFFTENKIKLISCGYHHFLRLQQHIMGMWL